MTGQESFSYEATRQIRQERRQMEPYFQLGVFLEPKIQTALSIGGKKHDFSLLDLHSL
jgi:hypothetical protein